MSPRSARIAIAAALVIGLGGSAPAAVGAVSPPPPVETVSSETDWRWPVAGERTVLVPFLGPVHEYASGHRGIDIAAPHGAVVRAPAPGIVAFVGVVVDRPLITIDHGGGRVTTFEPVSSDLLPGAVVSAGDRIGQVAAGGHARSRAMHLGLRLHGMYVDPMSLFGGVQRAVLIPCCAPL